jgi:succinoglycan biosynthesis protein ExoV
MQLYYYDKAPNFGDALNPWLWPRLLGNRLRETSSTLFLGIGTVLNENLPEAERYVVLSSGGGYGPFARIDERWKFYAVRGPLTARAFGLDPELAAIDGAYLLRKIALPQPVKAGPRIGFMPHWQTRMRLPWEQICEMSGLHYLNPLLPVDEILAQLQGCDGVIAEAMHAAITADALRIRWLPVRLTSEFLEFKWRDWMESVELDVTPVALPTTYHGVIGRKNESLLHRGYRTALNSTAYALWQNHQLVGRLKTLRRKFESNVNFGHLSADRRMNHQLDRLERALDSMRAIEN